MQCIRVHLAPNRPLLRKGTNLSILMVAVTVEALTNGAKLTALLLTEYNLSPAEVRQHYDWSGKNCPSQIRRARYGITWDDFMGMVIKYYDMLQPKPANRDKAPDGKLFRVALGAYEYRDNAEELIKRAEALGLGAYLLIVDDPRR